jgi:hypothetical protein
VFILLKAMAFTLRWVEERERDGGRKSRPVDVTRSIVAFVPRGCEDPETTRERERGKGREGRRQTGGIYRRNWCQVCCLRDLILDEGRVERAGREGEARLT